MKRRTFTTVGGVLARCLGCQWESRAKNAQANAARHHDAKGHTVEVSTELHVTYGDPHAQIPGQTSLEPT